MSISITRAVLALGRKSTYSVEDGKIVEWDIDGDTGEEQPSETQISEKITELESAEPMRLLREKRNRFLAETDWWASSDLTMSAKRKSYRQALRDLTKGLTTEELVNNVTWPTKPK